MKKRLLALVATAAMVMVTFVGCASPIDKFKEKFGGGSGTSQTSGQTTGGDEASYVADWLGEIGPFSVGQVVTIDDILQIPDEYKSYVKQIAMLDETGGLITELDTSAPGEYTVNLIADIEGTSGYTTTLNYIVTEKSAPVLPDELNKSLQQNTWSKLELSYVDATGKNATVSYVPSLLNLVSAFDAADSSNNPITWVTFIQTNEQEEEQARTKTSYLRTPDILIQLRNKAETIPAEQATLKKNVETLISVYDSLYKLTTSDTNKTIYDTNGKAYTIKQALVSYNNSADDTAIQGYYVNYDDKSRLLFVPVVKDDPNARLKTDVNNPGDLDLTREQQVSRVTEYVKGKAGDKAFAQSTNEAIATSFELFTSNILIGDASQLAVKGGNESTGGGDVTILDGSTGTAEPTSTATKTYAQKYPFLYKWPASPDGNVYRPWIYVITNNTTYLGSIWLGNEKKYLQNANNESTSLIEDKPTTTPTTNPAGATPATPTSTNPSNPAGTTPSASTGTPNISYPTTPSTNTPAPNISYPTTPSTQPGSSTQPSQPGQPSQSGQQESDSNWSRQIGVATDASRKITVSNGGNAKIKLDTGRSTNDSVVMLYGDRTYVITTLREAQLTSILKNGGLYPNEEKDFMTGTFKTDPKGMNEGPGPTNLGTIALHDLFWKDKSGQDHYGSYCAVWKRNNDFIVCYSDKIEQEGCAKLELLLRSCVK